jgi:hypothetical protein
MRRRLVRLDLKQFGGMGSRIGSAPPKKKCFEVGAMPSKE